jgi:hypothetical protein
MRATLLMLQATSSFTVTVIVTLPLAPTFTFPIDHDAFPPPVVQPPVHDANVVVAGIGSVMTTPVAFPPGPGFAYASV